MKIRRTKIVCTIGPATSNPDSLRALIRAGMNVARLNMSHGTHEQHAAVIASVRSLSTEIGQSIALLMDLSGPKVRVGRLPDEGITLTRGSEVVLGLEGEDTPDGVIPVSLPELIEAVPSGSRLMLDDGAIELEVCRRKRDSLVCNVVIGGVLTSNKGVNAPGISLPIASVTDKDLEDLRFGIQQCVDWFAISFVRNASDVAVVRGVCNASRARIPIIAKIEKHEAVSNIDEIIHVVDGVMVARGDLGVEIPIDQVPSVQKMIIRRCNAAGKPVITATQMLDSMIRNPRPTRAEVSDVANALYDGTDAIMLSGETAVGKYPVESVQMMDSVATYTEASITQRTIEPADKANLDDAVTQAIAQATCEIAGDLNAAAIITATSSGRTAVAVSRYRPKAPIIAVTSRAETYQRLALIWGVQAIRVGVMDTSDNMMQASLDAAKGSGLVAEGDPVILTGGVPVGRPGNTNFLKVHRIGAPLVPE